TPRAQSSFISSVTGTGTTASPVPSKNIVGTWTPIAARSTTRLRVVKTRNSPLPYTDWINHEARVTPGAGIGMHRSHRRWFILLFLAAAIFPLSGCLFRTRPADRQFSKQPLKTATQQEL